MNALARVTFEKRLAGVRKHVLATAKALAAFWDGRLEPHPDVNSLRRLLKRVFSSTAASEQSFKELVSLKSGSLAVLRMVREGPAPTLRLSSYSEPHYCSTPSFVSSLRMTLPRCESLPRYCFHACHQHFAVHP